MTHSYQRYILSPERLYLDCWTRHFLRKHLDPAQIRTACNVGIGPGEFDDWLGYLLAGHATLTSVDIDHTVVHAFRERQRDLAHPNPAQVVHGDLMQLDLGPFDLVTVVGSTVHETHIAARALNVAQRWVRPGGWFYATIIHSMGNPSSLLSEFRGELVVEEFTALEKFTAVLAHLPGPAASAPEEPEPS